MTIISISEARQILGKRGKEMSDSEIQEIISIFQILADTWLDSHERSLFKGKTLKELT